MSIPSRGGVAGDGCTGRTRSRSTPTGSSVSSPTSRCTPVTRAASPPCSARTSSRRRGSSSTPRTRSLHGKNLFSTTLLNYPNGVDLAQNTGMPLLGLLTAPLTLAVNPIASMNLLRFLAFTLSAYAAYFVIRRCHPLGTGGVRRRPAVRLLSVHGLPGGAAPEPRVRPPATAICSTACSNSSSCSGLRRGGPGSCSDSVQRRSSTFRPRCSQRRAARGRHRGLLSLLPLHPRSVPRASAHAAIGLGVGLVVLGGLIAYPTWLMLPRPPALRRPGPGLQQRLQRRPPRTGTADDDPARRAEPTRGGRHEPRRQQPAGERQLPRHPAHRSGALPSAPLLAPAVAALPRAARCSRASSSPSARCSSSTAT